MQITESWNELTYYISTKCFLGKIINEPFILHFLQKVTVVLTNLMKIKKVSPSPCISSFWHFLKIKYMAVKHGGSIGRRKT